MPFMKRMGLCAPGAFSSDGKIQFVLSNGDTILLNNGEARLGPRIHVEDIYVDGNDISGLSTAVLRDRQMLSEDGMVSILISMDSRSGKLLTRPVIISRGFVYMKDSFHMIREAEKLVETNLSKLLQGKTTFGEIKNTTRDTLSSYFYRKTKTESNDYSGYHE